MGEVVSVETKFELSLQLKINKNRTTNNIVVNTEERDPIASASRTWINGIIKITTFIILFVLILYLKNKNKTWKLNGDNKDPMIPMIFPAPCSKESLFSWAVKSKFTPLIIKLSVSLNNTPNNAIQKNKCLSMVVHRAYEEAIPTSFE